ncbi:membrane protein, putative [Hydrogenimonas sp.]|nr:membrane protein, putative [Hydrogenimonas sp.]
MAKMSGLKVMLMVAGAIAFAATGLHAEMKCAPGKCGGSMMKSEKSGPMSEEQPGEAMKKMNCNCEKNNSGSDKKEGAKGKCGSKGMKCAPGKCGGM